MCIRDRCELLAGLADLKTLKLWGAHISDSGITQLVGLEKLESLGLENTE